MASTELPVERLDRLRTQAPWALFEAIRQVGEPSNQHHDRLFREARTWAENESRSVSGSVLTSICWSLIETDSSRVLTVIDAMKPNLLLMAAGLRNGSVQHGMQFVRSILVHSFEPGQGDGVRDRIVEQASHRHGEQICRQLQEQLARPDLPALDVNAYLALLGHFRFAGFDKLIMDVWQSHQDQVLPYALWVAARCPLQETEAVLKPLVERLASIQIEDDYPHPPTARDWMILYIGWGFRRGITEEGLAFLLRSVERHEKLRHDVFSLVEGVDHPDAAEFVARDRAAWSGGDLWSRPGIGDGEPKSFASSLSVIERLRICWESDEEPKKVRVQAFCMWLEASGTKDAALLRCVDSGSPFYQYAVQHRIKLGDPSVVSDLLELLRSDDLRGWWWVLAHRVWCEELRSFASDTLAGFHDKVPADFSGGPSDLLLYFAQLLVKIPVGNGEALLRQHWGHLKYSRWMILAAFRIGTQTCVDLAREALLLCPADVDVFHHAFLTVFVQNAANPITLRHLQNLEPSLVRMDRNDVCYLAQMWEQTLGSNDGIAEWIRRHLVPLLHPEDRSRVRETDEMFVEYLDRFFQETRFVPYVGFLFEERGGQRFVFRERQLWLLDGWLSTHRTVRGLEFAAECLKHIGKRQDLDLLNRYPIEGDPSSVELIKADARFSIWKRTLV